jgi:glycosyltransferase involved in cell wall biosynthesis
VESLVDITDQIFVIDSFSQDDTVEIATSLGARVYQNPWKNHANQFQWALTNCPIETPWVMRMDADEYVTPELAQEIKSSLPNIDELVSGLIIKRQVHFMDRWIKHGGYYPIKLLRIWRNGLGTIEQRWMDEHIVLSEGITQELQHDIVDHNLNNLSWWTEKHNNYATREAVDLLNKEYGFFQEDESLKKGSGQDGRKRWYKDNLYARSPLFLRAFLYYLFRYFIQLGFLDGRPGLIWHFLQGFWYRFLVDAKIYHIKFLAKKEGTTVAKILSERYDFPMLDV